MQNFRGKKRANNSPRPAKSRRARQKGSKDSPILFLGIFRRRRASIINKRDVCADIVDDGGAALMRIL